MPKLLMTSFVATVIVLLASPAYYAQGSAQSTVSDQDLQLLRKDLRSMKKQLVAANMQLTDAEAEKFWPVYDQYSAEETKVYDSRYQRQRLRGEFQQYDECAGTDPVKRSALIDDPVRQKYLPPSRVVPQRRLLCFPDDRRLAL
jgi:hypothetical protein